MRARFCFMSGKKPPKNRLKLADIKLWQDMTRDVSRRAGADYTDVSDDEADDAPVEVPEMPAVRPVLAAKAGGNPVPRGAGGIDGRTEARLRKGQIRPEATLDLHGMGQVEAHGALVAFVGRCAARGLRCVLVITGKGRGGLSAQDFDWLAPKRGVLKSRVPDWLVEPAMAVHVARFVEAKRRDGGDGALYVYLRRAR